MQCNKNQQYDLAEKEAGLYHLLLTFKIHFPREKRYEEQKRRVKVSQKDFQTYRDPETQKVVGYTEIEILHDPTINQEVVKTMKPAKSKET